MDAQRHYPCRRHLLYTTAQGKTKSADILPPTMKPAAALTQRKIRKIKAAPHRARRYLGAVSGGSKRQDMLYVLPAVSVSFQKQSANTVITSGNRLHLIKLLGQHSAFF